MSKYLLQVSYTADGARGLLKDGGSKRRQVAEQAVKSAGGSMEAFYYTYGQDDVVIICDLPDAASGIALSLATNASGAVSLTTTPLITPEEVDAACKKVPAYRAPGA